MGWRGRGANRGVGGFGGWCRPFFQETEVGLFRGGTGGDERRQAYLGPRARAAPGRLLGRDLCQGAALHYVDGRNGVKDFDVWSFYAQHDDWPFPARWRGTRDFGPSKFGRYPGDPPGYAGRRVDLLGRSLPAVPAPTQPMSCGIT